MHILYTYLILHFYRCNRLVIDPPLCKHNCIGHKNTPADQEEEEPEDNNVKLLIKPGLESSGNEIEVEAETLDNEIRVKTKPQESPMKHKSESLENGVRLEPKAPESEVRNEPKTAGNKVKKERDSMENEILGLLLASENKQKVETVENQKKPERQNTGTKKEVHLTLTGAGNKKGVDIITRNTTKSSIEEEGGRRETNRANRYRGSKNNNNRANKELKNRLDKLLGTGGKVNG